MEGLNKWLKPLLEAKWFMVIVTLVMFANPVVLFPQVLAVFATGHPEEIILATWAPICAIQLAIALNAVKDRNAGLFFSMALCQVETMTIVVVTLIRRWM